LQLSWGSTLLYSDTILFLLSSPSGLFCEDLFWINLPVTSKKDLRKSTVGVVRLGSPTKPVKPHPSAFSVGHYVV